MRRDIKSGYHSDHADRQSNLTPWDSTYPFRKSQPVTGEDHSPCQNCKRKRQAVICWAKICECDPHPKRKRQRGKPMIDCPRREQIRFYPIFSLTRCRCLIRFWESWSPFISQIRTPRRKHKPVTQRIHHPIAIIRRKRREKRKSRNDISRIHKRIKILNPFIRFKVR